MSDHGDRPAFPLAWANTLEAGEGLGLSAREYFAAKAMQGILASGPTADRDATIPHLLSTIANMSVLAADALIAALARTGTEG
ncbi:hypothetical protein [Thalassobaculum sp.]|uniref:hypothetical protein n=1 Tax=Thalassobaculum sp. TaxID=2022740 RepID=UPI0032ECD97D